MSQVSCESPPWLGLGHFCHCWKSFLTLTSRSSCFTVSKPALCIRREHSSQPSVPAHLDLVPQPCTEPKRCWRCSIAGEDQALHSFASFRHLPTPPARLSPSCAWLSLSLSLFLSGASQATVFWRRAKLQLLSTGWLEDSVSHSLWCGLRYALVCVKKTLPLVFFYPSPHRRAKGGRTLNPPPPHNHTTITLCPTGLSVHEAGERGLFVLVGVYEQGRGRLFVSTRLIGCSLRRRSRCETAAARCGVPNTPT